MDSRRKKKKKAIKMLNKQLAEEKTYRALKTNKRLMRFLKESGQFANFIDLVRKKHHIGFQAAINLIKSYPNISFLIRTSIVAWSAYGYNFTYNDNVVQWYTDNFYKYRPLC